MVFDSRLTINCYIWKCIGPVGREGFILACLAIVLVFQAPKDDFDQGRSGEELDPSITK